MEISSIINPVIILAGVFLMGFIPAKIAESKDRSFVLFYIFGSFCFIPALILAACIGNKYDDERASGKGIMVIITAAITAILTPRLINWFDALSIAAWETLVEKFTNEQLIIIALGTILLAVLIALLAGLLVAWLLKRPISFIVRQLNQRNESTALSNRYAGHRNQDVLLRLEQAIPLLERRKNFFKRRDRYASYDKLNLWKILKIAIPPAIIVAEIVSYLWDSIAPAQEYGKYGKYGAQTIPHLWWIVFGIVFAGCIISSKLIANGIVKRAKKLDAIDEKRGYTTAINKILPEFPSKDYRLKRARIMKAIFKLNITDSVGMADYYADMVEKGVKLAKIAAAVAIPVVVGAKVVQAARDGLEDSYMPGSGSGFTGGSVGGGNSSMVADERAAKKKQKELDDACIRADNAWKDAEIARKNGYVDQSYVDKMWKEREDATRAAGWESWWW